MARPTETTHTIELKLDTSGMQFGPNARDQVNSTIGATGRSINAVGAGVQPDGTPATIRQRVLSPEALRQEVRRAMAVAIARGQPVSQTRFRAALREARNGDFVEATQAYETAATGVQNQWEQGQVGRAQAKISALQSRRMSQVDRLNRFLARNPNAAGSADLQAAIADATRISADPNADISTPLRRAYAAQAQMQDDLRANGPPSRSHRTTALAANDRMGRKINEWTEEASKMASSDPNKAKLQNLISQYTNVRALHSADITDNTRDSFSDADERVRRDGARIEFEAQKLRKENNKDEKWMNRAGALSMAMATRSGLARLGAFGQQMATSEGDVLGTNAVVGGVKAGTGIATDVATNRFIMKPSVGGFGALLGIGLLDSIVSTFQAAIQRGVEVRRNATERAQTHDAIISNILARSTTPSTMAMGTVARFSLEDASRGSAGSLLRDTQANMIGAGVPSSVARLGIGLIGYGAGVKTSDFDIETTIANQQRKRLQNIRYWSNFDAAKEWSGLVTEDSMYKGMSALTGSGINLSMMAKQEFGPRTGSFKWGRYIQRSGGYREGISEASLGAEAAGLSALSGAPMEAIASLMMNRAMGFGGDGRAGARHLTALTQQGLPSQAIEQFSQAAQHAALSGMTINPGTSANYMNSLLSAGVGPGRVAQISTGLMGTRIGARKTIGAGFDGMLEQAALVSALEATGGDLAAAQAMVAGMSDYEQVQSSKKYFGETITQMSLQSKLGLSPEEAKATMGAGPTGTLSTSPEKGWLSAFNKNVTDMALGRKLMSKAYSVGEENYNAKIQGFLQSASASLAEAAAAMGGAPESPQ